MKWGTVSEEITVKLRRVNNQSAKSEGPKEGPVMQTSKCEGPVSKECPGLESKEERTTHGPVSKDCPGKSEKSEEQEQETVKLMKEHTRKQLHAAMQTVYTYNRIHNRGRGRI